MPEDTKVSTSKALQVLNFFRSVAAGKEQQEEQRRAQALRQLHFAAQEHRQRREFAMTKMIDYMKGLIEGPNKDLARARFKGYYESLPDYEKEVLAPHFTQLFSPTEEKEIEFKRLRGTPVDPSIVDPTTDPVTRATLEFARADYLADRDKYVLGIDRGKDNTIPLGENVWAWRDKDGKMGILSREGSAKQEWVQKTLDKADMTWDMAMTQGGQVPSGPAQMITDGKIRYELTPMVNVLDKTRSFRKIPIGRVAREGERELPKIVSDFATSFALGEGVGVWETLKGGAPEGAALYDEFQDRLDELEEVMIKGEVIPYSKLDPRDQMKVVKQTITDVLGPNLAGFNVEVFDPGRFKGTSYNRFAQSTNASIVFVPGIPQAFYNSDGEVVGFHYYDADYDVVRDRRNKVLGTKAEIDAEAATSPAGAWLPKEEK